VTKSKPVAPKPVLAWAFRGHWQTFKTKAAAIKAHGRVVGSWNCIRVEIRPAPKRKGARK